MAETKPEQSHNSSIISGRARGGTIGERSGRNQPTGEIRRETETDETSRRRERARDMRMKNRSRQMR